MTTLATALSAQQPEELGQVAWQRDFAAATVAAQRSDRPLLVLLTEVPG